MFALSDQRYCQLGWLCSTGRRSHLSCWCDVIRCNLKCKNKGVRGERDWAYKVLELYRT